MSKDVEVGKDIQNGDRNALRPIRLRDIDLNFKQILIIMVILWGAAITGAFLWSLLGH